MRSDDQVIRHWAVHNNNNDLCAINTTGNWFIFYSNYLSSDTRDFPSSSISVEGVKPHQWRFCIDLISSLVQFIISRNIHFNIFNWKKYIRATRCLSKLTSALICIHGRTRLKWPIRPDRYFAFDRFVMPLMAEDSWIFNIQIYIFFRRANRRLKWYLKWTNANFHSVFSIHESSGNLDGLEGICFGFSNSLLVLGINGLCVGIWRAPELNTDVWLCVWGLKTESANLLLLDRYSLYAN